MTIKNYEAYMANWMPKKNSQRQTNQQSNNSNDDETLGSSTGSTTSNPNPSQHAGHGLTSHLPVRTFNHDIHSSASTTAAGHPGHSIKELKVKNYKYIHISVNWFL